MGVDPPPLTLDAPEGTTIKLPDDFAIVPYIAGDIILSLIPNGTARPAFAENRRAGVPDEVWLNHLHKVLIEKDGMLQETPVTYSGFFSHSQRKEDVRPRATVGVFPVYYDKASSTAMQKHSMLVVMKAIEFVNPGQVPVIEGDCPLYAQQKINKESLEHPESSAAEQKKFLKHLKALCDLVKDDKVVNPFKEMGPDLITLDTGEVMDHEIANCLREAPNIGKAMFMEFVRDRIEKATKPLSDVIPRANLFTFTNKPPVDLKKGANKLRSAKVNTALVTKLFLSLQAHPDSDMD
ncbi:hypothetical protein AAFF_G00307400 [Aldrovandia affinis]|uniref:Uncharacterized protein n=1 Tax=Aldrovandia affinis TaxID=143900 RepID=A0AAD7W195_9TELE|nr:hypothetical protein AAFF_G00307400 [Aldrovandia affinis]